MKTHFQVRTITLLDVTVHIARWLLFIRYVIIETVPTPELILSRHYHAHFKQDHQDLFMGITGGGLALNIIMLNTLGWKNLEARCRDSRLNILYNITDSNTAVSAKNSEWWRQMVEQKQTIISNVEPWERLKHSSMDRLSPEPFQNGTDCQLLQLMQSHQHCSTRD